MIQLSDDPDVEIERGFFDSLVSDLSGTAFQTWFENLMKHLDPKFTPIGHEGRGGGDHGCDGFSISSGRFFQVYAPESMKENLKKIEHDFKRALEKWKGLFNTWVFVHGKLKIKPTIEKHVIELAEDNDIELLPWSEVDIWKLLLELPRDDRLHLLNMPAHFKDVPMRKIHETHEMVGEIKEKLDEDSYPDEEEFDAETVALAKRVSANFDEIHNMSNEDKKRVFLHILKASVNESELHQIFQTLSKLFTDDYDIVTLTIDCLQTKSKWSDQIAEDAISFFLSKSKDNRVPDAIYYVAADPTRDSGQSKLFRKVYFRFLGQFGRKDHIPLLEDLKTRECNNIIRGYIERTVLQLKKRFPDAELTRIRLELESVRSKLTSGQYPIIDMIQLNRFLEKPTFSHLSSQVQDKFFQLEMKLREYNEFRKKTSGLSRKVPAEYGSYALIGRTHESEKHCQSISSLIDELLALI